MRPHGRQLSALLLALGVAGPALARSPTEQLRLPLQNDFDRCALLAADQGNANIQGRVRLQLLLRASGNVYASYVHSAPGVDDKRLFACLTGFSLFWKFPAQALDGVRPYEVTFVPGGTELDLSPGLYWSGIHYAGQGRASVFMPSVDDVPEPKSQEPALAQRTLEVADWTTDAERGIAELAVGRAAQAIPLLREGLKADANDPIALRGLAQALAESGGDLVEARASADLLAAQRPASMVGHEALVRVCLVSGDDACIVRAFNAASHAADVGPRARLLAELQPRAEQAAERLNRNLAQARKLDSCAGLSDEKALAQCLVRKCLDAGTNAWAAEHKGRPGPWLLGAAGADKFVASRALGEGLEDARWLVTMGAKTVRMRPVNASAREVSERQSRCATADAATLAKDKGLEIEQPIVRVGSPRPGGP